MIFFDSPNPAPNPRRVRIFAAEKGIALPSRELSIPAREHKSPEFLALNPRGQTPALQLDDGTVIAESVAICRYLEGLHPEPPLFGTGAKEQALIEMWNRRVEMILMPPIGAVWVHTHPFTARLPGRNAEWGEANRPRIEEAMRFFDAALAGREFLAADHYSISDVLLLTTVDFSTFIGMPVPEDLTHLRAWHARVSARPSAAA
ncbi:MULTISPECIES: glutathione S-transferase family protein [unclassified Novosphingobium]|uniref:glutathione S-transferase family protein n=1 Tax=unclassified Novosphingobium TaxID=2644732 RepID=UPI0025FFBC3C|nr:MULTISPECIES: glutathione S-transferase family protein [unclassified Novosphingobium]HQV02942.1 glutathione S-transferase family protein [Novosphingobium sp.]